MKSAQAGAVSTNCSPGPPWVTWLSTCPTNHRTGHWAHQPELHHAFYRRAKNVRAGKCWYVVVMNTMNTIIKWKLRAKINYTRLFNSINWCNSQGMMRSEIFHTFQCTVMTKLFLAEWQHITLLFWSQKNCGIHSFPTMCHNLLVQFAKVV